MAKAEPIYVSMPGWQKDTTGIRKWDDLPKEAKDYLRFMEDRIGARIMLVSVGARREQTIFI
jgi:adenylosuccinate synthase